MTVMALVGEGPLQRSAGAASSPSVLTQGLAARGEEDVR
jgi:hypothetical protein